MCDTTKPTAEPKRLDVTLKEYRDDWEAVARYTVRYQGLYFNSASHIRRVLAQGLTLAEACRLREVEKARMRSAGEEGHILFDLERPEETRETYRQLRAARDNIIVNPTQPLHY